MLPEKLTHALLLTVEERKYSLKNLVLNDHMLIRALCGLLASPLALA